MVGCFGNLFGFFAEERRKLLPRFFKYSMHQNILSLKSARGNFTLQIWRAIVGLLWLQELLQQVPEEEWKSLNFLAGLPGLLILGLP